MAPHRVVIIGAGPAGLATARGYREAGGEGAVTLIGAEPHLPYRRPPLTKEFLRSELARTELTLEQASWFAERSVELWLGTPAQAIDPVSGEVRLAGGQSVAADACVLATGARPQRLPVPGADQGQGALTARVAVAPRDRQPGRPRSDDHDPPGRHQ